MKLNNLTKGAIAFSVLSIIASGALVASAATDTSTSTASTAVTRQGCGRGPAEKRIKPEDMTAAQKAEMEAKRTEMETKMTAVKNALAASDYNAWVTAEKAMNENSPILSKITADNFSKYVQAYNLRVQADAIMKDLGIDNPGMGQGMPGLGHGGFGHGPKDGAKSGSSVQE